MDSILEDLRKAHVGRSDGAPKSTVAEELKRDLEEVVKRKRELLFIHLRYSFIKYILDTDSTI